MLTDTRHDVLWWIALIVGVVGILAYFITIPVMSTYAFWLVALGFVLFLIGPEFTHKS